MTIDDPTIRELSEADPARGVADGPYDRIEGDRVLSRVLDNDSPGGRPGRDPVRGARAPRRPWRVLGPVLSLIVVLAVVAVVVIAGHHGRMSPSPASPSGDGHAVTLVYRAIPTPAAPRVTPKALNETVAIMRVRIDQLGVSPARTRIAGKDLISVTLPDVRNLARAEAALGATAQLTFYDWEANVLLPSGHSVASQLPTRNPQAEQISEGGPHGPGGVNAGGVSLYQAVKLASQQAPTPSSQLCATAGASGCITVSRRGSQYWLFGKPGSAACAAAAAAIRSKPIRGDWCYLTGPDSTTQSLRSAQLPAAVSFRKGTMLTVPQGTVVMQATDTASPGTLLAYTDTSAQYFVLRDRVSLTGSEITNPQASTDTGGQPDVTFGFTSRGAKAFQTVTSTVAHRGSALSIGSNHLFQHFMVALDGQVLSAPQIDFTQYPDGIVSAGDASGGEITGGFTAQAAKSIAAELRLGVLPLNLKRVGQRP